MMVSFIFYGFWRVDFLFLIFFSILVDYFCGHRISISPSKSIQKKIYLAISILCNLGLLFYFKYFNFGIENLNILLETIGASPLKYADVILPVGISFFTFQTMSYSIDIYRGEIKPSRSLINFATYVSMFPQLVAGPIVRYKEIESSLVNFKKDNILFKDGLVLFIIGFNKKVMIANNVSELADFAFKVNGADTQTAMIGAVAYTLQIYFDFSGYSDMAIGLGKMFGFKFPANFSSPYKAKSITDFWNRWHMTLSRWFKDYLYIPLGGNQKGQQRTYVNLFVVMFLCGLWHGAAWTFIIWGMFHGIILIFERMNGRKSLGYHRLPGGLQVLITFGITVIGWIPFRAASFEQLTLYMEAFLNKAAHLPDSAIYAVFDLEKKIFLILGLIIVFSFKNTMESKKENHQNLIDCFNLLLFIPAVHELMNQSYNPFLYFNF